MCLFTKQNKASVAKNDIVCYKVVKLDKVTGVYRTPFMHTVLDKTLEGKHLYARIVFTWHPTTEGEITRLNPYGTEDIFPYIIEDGAIHTYKRKSAAEGLIKFFNRTDDGTAYSIFECIIPAGTRYYIGNECMNGRGPICFASDKIKIIKKTDYVFSSES